MRVPARRHRPRRARQPRRPRAGGELVHARAGAAPPRGSPASRARTRNTSATTTTATSTCRRQAETMNMNRVLYREWFPQIVYNHHQTAPPGTVMFAPPFRDPFNYVFDPLIPVGIDLVGAAMHARFAAEGKAGVTMRGGSNYSTWWNGGLRTTRLLPQPDRPADGDDRRARRRPTIPFVARASAADGDLPFPIAPQRWHFRQSIDYSLTANRAVLDFASRYRETLLFNVYRMGQERHRARQPRHVDDVAAAVAALRRPPAAQRRPPPARRAASRSAAPRPARLHPAGGSAGLSHRGQVRRRAAQGGRDRAPRDRRRSRSAGRTLSRRVVRGAGRRRRSGRTCSTCSSRRIIPTTFRIPGGPPMPPYDNAGWTLAFQMGVKFDRILDAFEGPFEALITSRRPRRAAWPARRGQPAIWSATIRTTRSLPSTGCLRPAKSVYWLRDRTAGAVGRHRRDLHCRQADRRARSSRRRRVGPGSGVHRRGQRAARRTRSGCGRSGSACGIATAARARAAGRAGCSSATSSRSRSSTRRRSTRAIWRAASTSSSCPTTPCRAHERRGRLLIDDVPAEYRSTPGRDDAGTGRCRSCAVRRGGRHAASRSATRRRSPSALGVPVTNALRRTSRIGDARRSRRRVLRAGLGAARDRGQHDCRSATGSSARSTSSSTTARRSVSARARRARRPARGVVRVGAPLRSGWAWGQQHLDGRRRRSSRRRSARGRVLMFGPEITYPRAVARHVQVPVQRHPLRARRQR